MRLGLQEFTLASAPLAGCRQITLPLHLAAQSANRGLCVQSAPTTEGLSPPPPSWSEPAPPHCLTHQLIIDFNVCAHALNPMCKYLMSLCTFQLAEMAYLEAERRANGEQRHFLTRVPKPDPAPFAARVLPHADAAPASPWWPELCPPRRQFRGRNSAARDTNGGSATRR